jgi:hypothetical protein
MEGIPNLDEIINSLEDDQQWTLVTAEGPVRVPHGSEEFREFVGDYSDCSIAVMVYDNAGQDLFAVDCTGRSMALLEVFGEGRARFFAGQLGLYGLHQLVLVSIIPYEFQEFTNLYEALQLKCKLADFLREVREAKYLVYPRFDLPFEVAEEFDALVCEAVSKVLPR